MFTVCGSVLFGESSFTFSGASIYVRVLDVSIADAPSKVVAEKTLSNIGLSKENPRPVSFSMQCPMLDPQRMYSIEVHVDIDGDGKVAKGDYITMESYPVIMSNSIFRINVKVWLVK